MRTLILCLYYWLVPMMVHGVHAETTRPLFDLTRSSRRRISDYEFRTFKGVWCDVLSWLQEDPDASAVVLLGGLQEAEPDRFSRAHLRTLQRRVQQWRGIMAKKLVYATAGEPMAGPAAMPELALVGRDPRC